MDPENIRRDFISFADPGTVVTVDDRSVRWTQNRAQQQLTFAPSQNDLPDIIFGNRRLGYSEFFASERMADLRGLAHGLQRFLQQLPGFVSENDYVESLATSDGVEQQRASQVLHQVVTPSGAGAKTRIIFLRGRAGDGKTALLIRSAQSQALAYELGQVSWLYFYVDAQGSTLARIDEVIAKVTQDLRARFTYHAVATLTRLGLLVPVIDGFDELLGVGGYRDAFSSLALFVSRMGGKGALVASARSTFYQYTTFGQQAARFASDELPLDFEIIPAELEPWGDSQATAFLAKSGVDVTIDQLRRGLGSRAEEILSSPFLLSSLARYVDLTHEVGGPRHLVRQIVDAMIRREMVEKLLDPQGKPLLTLEQHKSLLGALAEEMWWQESRELDEQTFITIGQMICEQFGLEGAVAERLLNRMPTHALLTRTENPRRVLFRHEFYFGFFLGTLIARRALSHESVNDLLTRAVISTVVADEVAATLRFDGQGDFRPLVAAVDERRSSPTSIEVANQNAGTLFGALVREFGSDMSGSVLREGSLSGVDLSRTSLRGTEFKKCTFTEVDLRDCDWRGVTLVDCALTLVKVSDSGRLEVTGLQIPGSVLGLKHFPHGSAPKETYDPREIRTILSELGAGLNDIAPAQELGPNGREVTRQLDRFLRTVQRTLYFSDNDFANRGLNLSTDLRQVFELLRTHGLLVAAKREIRGQRPMYRLTASVQDIRQGEAGVFSSAEVRAFWLAIRALDTTGGR